MFVMASGLKLVAQMSNSRMIGETPQAADVLDDAPAVDHATTDAADIAKQPLPREFGGRDGPDPTRFGDWEKNGRCIDF